MYLGVAACVVFLSKAHALQHEYSWSGSARFAGSVGFIGCLALAAYGVGLPDRRSTLREAVPAAVLASVVAATAVSSVQLVVGDALLPRFVVVGSAVILMPWFVLCAGLAADAGSRAERRERVVVVAASSELETLEDDLHHDPERPALVVSWLTPVEARATVDGRRPVVDAVDDERATLVVLSRSAQNDDDIVAQVAFLHSRGVRVRTLSLFYEQWLGKLPIGELERVSLLFDIGELHGPTYARLKRVLDIGLAVLGLFTLALLVPGVALGNLFGGRGPLFFRQPRVGRNGTTFSIFKFRTMSASDSSTPTAADDARITPFGRVLRRTHLDELPQVLNVLRGDLSIVGPRPEQPQLVDELVAKIPFYSLRHLVRPGLTGWAQVKYQYAANDEETLQKLQYEFFYLRRQSLGLDLRIVARTVRSVAGRDGR
jgi:lipopolysaccharide/colanic/teichoic acid biosynthesis glycosyltransferase